MKDEQLLRYSRQIMLPQVDIQGQQALLDAHVLIVGVGGLGCPAALYLAAAGVGTISLVDNDLVEISNLQRQIAHTVADLGKPKVNSAQAALARLNPDIQVHALNETLNDVELKKHAAGVDLIVDCSDNFTTRYSVNAICSAVGIPLVSGAAIGMEGQLISFDFRTGPAPCYQCLYPKGADAELSCSENGVLASVTGVIGTLQATEAIKLLLGVSAEESTSLLVYDAQRLSFNKLVLNARLDCPICRT